MRKELYILFLLVCLFSCKKDEKRTEAERIVKEWVGKEIVIPSGFQCCIAEKDSVGCDALLNSEYKILLYTDSSGCTTCKLRLLEWKALIKDADSLFSFDKLSFLFVFQPKDKKELQFLFKRDNFNYPVMIDIENKMDAINQFPDKQSYQCFLLDRNNKVLMIGNPVINPKIWKLYKEQIYGKINKNEERTTTVEIEKMQIDLGYINISNSKSAIFNIKNTGSHPLVISHVSVSCGCTSVEWEKQPVKPGMAGKITLRMKPEEKGYFNKTVDVFCNVENAPLKLKINGTAN